MTRAASFFFVLALPALSFGQDYLITSRGDTLKGKINISSYELVDKAEVRENKKKTTLMATQTRELVIGGDIYRPQKLKDRYRFMKLLKSGYLSLYGFRAEGQATFDSPFLAMVDGRSTEVPHLSFRTVVARFLKDCPDLADRVEKGANGELGKKDLDKIIDEYNACMDQKTSIRHTEAVEAAPAAVSSQLQLLAELKQKVNESTDLAGRQDALDLLADIEAKLKSNQPIPNYQVNGLQGFLANTPLKDDLERFIGALGKH